MRRMARSWRRVVRMRLCGYGILRGEKPSLDLDGHTGSISCLAYAPNGSQLASGSWDLTRATVGSAGKNPPRHLAMDILIMSVAWPMRRIARSWRRASVGWIRRLRDLREGKPTSRRLRKKADRYECRWKGILICQLPVLCAGWVAVGVG